MSQRRFIPPTWTASQATPTAIASSAEVQPTNPQSHFTWQLLRHLFTALAALSLTVCVISICLSFGGPQQVFYFDLSKHFYDFWTHYGRLRVSSHSNRVNRDLFDLPLWIVAMLSLIAPLYWAASAWWRLKRKKKQLHRTRPDRHAEFLRASAIALVGGAILLSGLLLLLLMVVGRNQQIDFYLGSFHLSQTSGGSIDVDNMHGNEISIPPIASLVTVVVLVAIGCACVAALQRIIQRQRRRQATQETFALQQQGPRGFAVEPAKSTTQATPPDKSIP